MRINIPNMWVAKKSLKNFPAKEDKKALMVWTSPLGKKSGYAIVKYFEPKKEVFENAHIKNATGDLRIEKFNNGDKAKQTIVVYLDDFESIALDPVKEANKDVKA